MLSEDRDTIVALSTPPGKSGIAVLRLSGPRAMEIAAAHFLPGKPSADGNTARTSSKTFPHGRVRLGRVLDQDGRTIDHGLALAFHEPNSYTGEHLVEFHLHGSPYIVDRVLKALLHHATAAEPGEFTRRAVTNGKLDLAQAEAVHALVEAASDWGHQLALRALDGNTSRKVDLLRSRALELLALLEAELDFSGEEIPELPPNAIDSRMEEILVSILRWRETYRSGRLAGGAQVVLAGEPNAGKSTLMNALLGEDRVIVDEAPGTTRDSVSQCCALDRLRVTYWDTAGLRESPDRVERAGIRRTRELLEHADLVILLIPPESADLPPLPQLAAPVLLVGTMSDLPVFTELTSRDLSLPGQSPISESRILSVSAKTGEGLGRLKETISRILLRHSEEQEELVISEFRHFQLLGVAEEALKRGRSALSSNLDRSLLAADLRECAEALGAIHGGFEIEEVLDEIFNRFCIGK